MLGLILTVVLGADGGCGCGVQRTTQIVRTEKLALSFLESKDPEVRLSAVVSLGSLGTEQSRPALMLALEDDSDWRIVCAAARSLNTTRAAEAATAMKRISESHWYPPTRQCVARALAGLEAGELGEAHSHPNDVPNGSPWRWTPRRELLLLPEEMSRLNCGEGTRRGQDGLPRIPDGRLCGSSREEVEAQRAFSGGLLVGEDRGEFGGGLRFKRGASVELLSSENVFAILELKGTPIVITGLGHMWLNRGNVWRVSQMDGRVTLTHWKKLPGYPLQALQLKNGAIYVSCSGGDVVVFPDGRMAMATDETTR